MNLRHAVSSLILFSLLTGCEVSTEPAPGTALVGAEPAPPTAAAAAEFVAAAEQRLAELGQYSERVAWVQSNFITADTERLAASANETMTAAQVEIATAAAQFIGSTGLDTDTVRKLDMLRNGITIPAPLDAAKTAEQAEIGARLKSLYGSGKYCRTENDCLALDKLEEIMAHSRDPAELQEAWEGWHRVAVPMKELYARQVELANEGARELGFDDLGT
ncbi:MAG: M2 family metallopeptidase, partial [Lysobacterales bacterium]